MPKSRKDDDRFERVKIACHSGEERVHIRIVASEERCELSALSIKSCLLDRRGLAPGKAFREPTCTMRRVFAVRYMWLRGN